MTVYKRQKSTYKNIIQLSIFLFLGTACNSKKANVSDDNKVAVQNERTEKPSDHTTEKSRFAASVAWTENEKAIWLKPCMLGIEMVYGEESAKKTCDCMLQKMQAKHKAFSEVDNTDPDESSKLMAECLDVNTDVFFEN